jgi:hypothetical protein
MTDGGDLWSVGEVSESNGQVMTIRFRERPALEVRQSLPEQFVVIWTFEDASRVGLPTSAGGEEAGDLEDRFMPHLEADGAALLVVVSTGEGIREWYFYCRDPQEIQRRFNEAVPEAGLPIELESGHDPAWSVYEQFVALFEPHH